MGGGGVREGRRERENEGELPGVQVCAGLHPKSRQTQPDPPADPMSDEP